MKKDIAGQKCSKLNMSPQTMYGIEGEKKKWLIGMSWFGECY